MPDISCLPVKQNVFYLDYVNGQQRQTIYTYDATSHVFTPTDAQPTSDITIVRPGGVFFLLRFSNINKFYAEEEFGISLVKVGLFSHLPPTSSPRVEFMRRRESVARRIAAVDSNKNFFANDVFEEAIPAGDDQFVLFPTISISLRGLHCDTLEENL